MKEHTLGFRRALPEWTGRGETAGDGASRGEAGEAGRGPTRQGEARPGGASRVRAGRGGAGRGGAGRGRAGRGLGHGATRAQHLVIEFQKQM